MKEYTIVYTAQVTKIIKTENDIEEALRSKGYEENLPKEIKMRLGADDVVIKKVQIFMRDVNGEL